MIKELLTVSVVLAICQAATVDLYARQGTMNRYFVYTQSNPRHPVEVEPTVHSVSNSPIVPSKKTVIIVHGHEGSATTTLNPQVKDEFLNNEDVNVVVVDWSVFASQSYSNAVSSVPSVGVFISYFVRVLEACGNPLSRIHLIGFHLGAHVVGFTGRNLNGRVARITGLDPAGSSWGSGTQRLTSTDALYVEVIHTDGDGLLSYGVGSAIGHVDFFMNGGFSQPGCWTHRCNHNRAFEFMAASMSNRLTGNRCTTMLQVNTNLCRGQSLDVGNNDLEKLGSGMYRANTGRTFPF